MGTPRSRDVPLPSRVSPARRDGYAASSSSIVEHTRRVAMEAQAYRTQVRQQNLEGSVCDDEELLPAGEAEQRIFRSFAQESPIYPDTAARQNVTVRRSRDRLSGQTAVARTPETVTSRRSSLRDRDRRYSLESSTAFRDHEIQYLDGLQLLEEPGDESAGRMSGLGNERVTRPLLESRKTSSPETRAFAEACMAAETLAAQSNAVASSSVEKRHSPSLNLEVEEDGDEEASDSDDGKPLPLFTRRDIPDAIEDPDINELLLNLWQRRKDASEQLVQAMEDDDIEAFEELERQVRNYNRLMLNTKAHYNKQKTMKLANDRYLQKSSPKFVGVDDLSLGPKPSPKEGTDEFRILLTYQGNQVFRKAHPRTLNRVIHYVAQQYLRDVFAVRVGSLSQILLLHKGEILSQKGKLEDVPVEDGDEIMVINLLQDEQVEKEQPQSHFRSGKRPSGHQDPEFVDDDADAYSRGAENTPRRSGNNREDYTPRGDHVGQQWEGSQPVYPGGSSRNHRGELHPLKGAQASSRPGTNGEANLCESPQGFQRGESHSLTNARAPSQPGTNGGAFTLREGGDSSRALVYDNRLSSPTHDPGARAHDKIRQSFKCPRFSGQPKDWKTWNKGFMRYLSIWELEYVLLPDFFAALPLAPAQLRDNKMVYYIIEDSVQSSPQAASYVRQAPLNNGFEAYYNLHDGFVFAGTTTATLLLNDLSNFRFLPDETPTALCLRLEELFEELELLPGNAAVTFGDTQRIGYLVNALRHEKEWDTVCSAITSAQIKGEVSFREACNELRFRCEATRAHELMDRPVRGKKVRGLASKPQADDEAESVENLSDKMFTLLSTMSKRHNLSSDKTTPDDDGTKNKGRRKFVNQPCLADGCTEETRFSLCGVHYHSLISAKITALKLRNGYGEATYDTATHLIVYPPRTPTDRLPSNSPRKVKAGLAGTDN